MAGTSNGLRGVLAAALLVALSSSAANAQYRETHDEGYEEERLSYGPPCEPRKTLLQWSYGTSFSGGPDRDEPLVTDRPDFTEASSTVGQGVLQLEAGYTYVSDRSGNDSLQVHSYPEVLLRAGVLAEWFELRIGWTYFDGTETAGGVRSKISGGDDLYLGMKIGLTPQECILPEMALVPQMTVPTGGGDVTSDEVLPGLNWLYGWDLNDRLSTAGSSQFNRAVDGDSGESYWEYAQSWTVGYALTERVGSYTEWFALVPDGADTERTEHYFNGGFTYLVHNDLQLDVRGGVGLNEAADDYFLGTGFSVRY